MKSYKLLLVGCFVLLLTACGSDSISQARLQDVEGKVFSFKSLQGKWVVLNYWASWCEPCKKEIPQLNVFYEKHRNDVAMYGVNFDQVARAELKLLMKKMNMHYPNLVFDPSPQLALGDIPGIPVTFVFNPQGRLVKKLLGEQTVASLEAGLFN